jgi:hypothetical protein
MTPVSHRIDRVDPLDLDLDLDLADLFTASERADGVPFQAKSGSVHTAGTGLGC